MTDQTNLTTLPRTAGTLASPAAQKPMVAGTRDPTLRKYFISQLTGTLWALGNDEAGEANVRAALAALEGFAPQDEAEGMLGVQMIATHHAAIECLKRALDSGPARDRSLADANKLLTLYIRQLQALDKRRGKGGGDVKVGTVNVEPGAQAIVGNVTPEIAASARGKASTARSDP